MDFTLDGSGTAQQQAWVNEAISGCTYPLTGVTAAVLVQWAATLPDGSDTSHPYMVTVPNVDGSCTITIASWADDHKAPGIQGLPSPAADVHDFYVDSFVHELGHVVMYNTFDTTPDSPGAPVTEMCGLFWQPAIGTGGRVYGSLDDWDASNLSWGGEIREAVADWFRLAFCGSRNVFWNRTKWTIDQSNWGEYLTLISPAGGGSGVALLAATLFLAPGMDVTGGSEFGGEMDSPGDFVLNEGGDGEYIIFTESFDPVNGLFGTGTVSAPGAIDLPLWLQVGLRGSNVVSSLWNTDPSDGGILVETTSGALSGPLASAVPYLTVLFSNMWSAELNDPITGIPGLVTVDPQDTPTVWPEITEYTYEEPGGAVHDLIGDLVAHGPGTDPFQPNFGSFTIAPGSIIPGETPNIEVQDAVASPIGYPVTPQFFEFQQGGTLTVKIDSLTAGTGFVGIGIQMVGSLGGAAVTGPFPSYPLQGQISSGRGLRGAFANEIAKAGRLAPKMTALAGAGAQGTQSIAARGLLGSQPLRGAVRP